MLYVKLIQCMQITTHGRSFNSIYLSIYRLNGCFIPVLSIRLCKAEPISALQIFIDII